MQFARAAVLLLTIALPAQTAGLDAPDISVTFSIRRSLLIADQLVQSASKIFKGAVPKTQFQKVRTLCAPSRGVLSARWASRDIALRFAQLVFNRQPTLATLGRCAPLAVLICRRRLGCRAASIMAWTRSCPRAPAM
jgi:hypothetical protein